MNRKTLLLHPLFLFTSVWSADLVLYIMRFSKLLNATDQEASSVIGIILIPYAVILGGATLFFHLAPKRRVQRTHLMCVPANDDEDLLALKRRLKKWLFVGMFLSLIEIVASGGLPLFWLVSGNPKTYADFGIPSLHGLVNSMLLALSVCYTGIFARYGGRRNLLCSLGIFFWAILLVTRNMMMVNFLQTGMVIVLYRGIPPKLGIKILAAVLVIILGFGFMGDLRSGADSFRTLAQPTTSYPEWLPSGVLWAYIYLTTPLNNLIYTIHSIQPTNNFLFPNTVAPLFPTVVRNVVYGESAEAALSGELVDSAFNVSTAYVGPYQDYGAFGMMGFSALISLIGGFYWWRNNFRDGLIYVVICQCLLITVFYDYFFSLPIITQVFWIYLFMRARKAKRSQTAMHAAPASSA